LTSILYSQSNTLSIAAELISIDETDKKVTHIEMVKIEYKILSILDGTYDKDTLSFYIDLSSIPKAKRVQLYLSQNQNNEYSFLLASNLIPKEETKFYVFVGKKYPLPHLNPKYQKAQ